MLTDELVPVYIALRLVNCSESALKSQLPRLSIKLEAFAFNSASPDNAEEEAAQPKDLIYSGAVRDTEDPFVIVHEVEDGEGIDNYVFVVWKAEAFLSWLTLFWRIAPVSLLTVYRSTEDPASASFDSVCCFCGAEPPEGDGKQRRGRIPS